MADMEGNTGKDLALEKLKNFEDKVKNSIKEKKNKEEGIILLENSVKTENNLGIELKYKQVKGKYIFSLGDKEIFTMDEKGIFTYNTENINAINKDKNNSIKNLEDSIGLPKIAEIERIKEEEQNEKEEKGAEEKAPEDKGAEEEKAEEEKPELENDIGKEEAAKSLGVESSKIIEIDTTRKITKQGSLASLISGFDIKGRYFISEDKDNPYKYHILRKNEETGQLENVKEEQNKMEQTEGTNPTEKIIKIDKDGNMTEVQARAMYYEKGKKNLGIAMVHDQQGRIEMLQYRRLPNDRYVAQVVPEKSVKNREITNNEIVRNMMDERQTSNVELQEQTDRFDKVKELEDVLPHDVDPSKNGINVEEIENNKALIETIKKEIEEDLIEAGVYPEDAKGKADLIFKEVFNEGKTYEQAKEKYKIQDQKKQGEDKAKEDDDGVRVPWDKSKF